MYVCVHVQYVYKSMHVCMYDCFPRQYSIGVTTGIAFCGVVGHPQRHEYTVIGQKVNMAARLMMKFPSAVTCDETTKTKSSIPGSQFTLAPPVTLKGISNPEHIHTFSTEMYVYQWEYLSTLQLLGTALSVVVSPCK